MLLPSTAARGRAEPNRSSPAALVVGVGCLEANTLRVSQLGNAKCFKGRCQEIWQHQDGMGDKNGVKEVIYFNTHLPREDLNICLLLRPCVLTYCSLGRLAYQ